MEKEYLENGYVVATPTPLMKKSGSLVSLFQNEFLPLFTADVQSNRNVIKRFADSFEVNRFFADPLLETPVKTLGIRKPVFCGPIVTHFTSNDATGDAYGLPFHQDWPSMASSRSPIIIWINLKDCDAGTHGIEVVPGSHVRGLHPGTQEKGGYVLSRQKFEDSRILSLKAGEVLFMSAFLVHRTYVHPGCSDWKLALSRRVDDLACGEWPQRRYANAYFTEVDRELYSRE